MRESRRRAVEAIIPRDHPAITQLEGAGSRDGEGALTVFAHAGDDFQAGHFGGIAREGTRT